MKVHVIMISVVDFTLLAWLGNSHIVTECILPVNSQLSDRKKSTLSELLAWQNGIAMYIECMQKYCLYNSYLSIVCNIFIIFPITTTKLTNKL